MALSTQCQTQMIPTPELNKMADARAAGSDTIGTFIDWLQQQGYVIAKWDNRPDHMKHDQLYPIHKPIENWLAEYFEIDLNKIDAERKALLDQIRSNA